MDPQKKKSNLEAENKEKENVENKEDLNFLDSCYNTQWILQLNKQKEVKGMLCLLCQQIAKNAMELTCDEHENSNAALIVGEDCLVRYLQQNSNKCPVEQHDNCKQSKNKLVRQYVDDIVVMCPRQYQLDLKQDSDTTNGNEQTNPEAASENALTRICNFQGKIKDVKEHLQGSCQLMTLSCSFKPFGCQALLFKYNYDDHVRLQVESHLALVMNQFNLLQQKVQGSENNQSNLQMQKDDCQ
ncbi:hypothetical protein RFI_37869, partial [Reticulomyxa filosa]